MAGAAGRRYIAAALSQAAGSMRTRCLAPLTGVCFLSCLRAPSAAFCRQQGALWQGMLR